MLVVADNAACVDGEEVIIGKLETAADVNISGNTAYQYYVRHK